AGSDRPLQELGSHLSLRQVRCRSALLYLTGADVLYEEHQRGGMERVWQVLRGDGPVAELLRPQAKLPVIANLKACFDGIDVQLGGRTWCVGAGALSEITLLSENYTARAETLQLLGPLLGAAEWRGNCGYLFVLCFAFAFWVVE